MENRLTKSAILATFLALMPAAGFAQLYKNADAPVADRVADLMSRMTVEEKIWQLNQAGFGNNKNINNIGEKLKHIPPQIGSLIYTDDDVSLRNAMQRKAMEESRLGIPILFGYDVIHGYRTVYPISLAQACSWNTELAEAMSSVAAREAKSGGIDWTFSPMIDVARDPRWGRVAEGYGEDPYLTSVMGVAAVEGYQGDDLTDPATMAACVKHFAGYGFAEGGRDYNTTWIPDGLLYDVVLPPFKAGADAGAATFMCSFNDIDGIPSSGNRRLLTDILRGEWGWDGLMVSDWGSIEQMLNHGYSTDRPTAALQAARAGVDMDMENHLYDNHLRELVESGKLSMEQLDALVRNALRLKFRLGLFENPYVDLKTAKRFYTPANLQAAQRAAEESAVLLKNNGVLPLAGNPGKILVTGPMADAAHDQNGTWCFDMEKDHTVTPLTSLREMYGADNIIYEPGLKFSRDNSAEGIAAAVAAAKDADVVLCFVGEEAVLSGEAHSRADISLPGAQNDLLAALKAAGKPVVTVVMAGRPLTIADQVALTDATLFNFHPGTMGGPAIANLLSGKVNPSGKLPVTFSKMVGQEPNYYNRKNTGRPHNSQGEMLIDDIPLEAGQTSTGCDSYYIDAGDAPAFPFGYGLSYTTFQQEMGPISESNGTITFDVTVTNTGDKAGKDVVEVYFNPPYVNGGIEKASANLVEFAKTGMLEPGASETVSISSPWRTWPPTTTRARAATCWTPVSMLSASTGTPIR